MVKIDSGELPSAIGKEGHELTQVVHEWQKVAHGRFPDDCSKLLQMIEETDKLRLWEKRVNGFQYKSRNEFLQKQVLIDFDLTEANVSRIVHLLKSGEIEAAQEVLKSKDKIRELNEKYPELSKAEIAETVNVSRQYVYEVLSSKSPQEGKLLDIPNHIKGKNQKTDFRKLPPELQQKVASRELSLNAAAIQAGIRKRPTANEVGLKAFNKSDERMLFVRSILDALTDSERQVVKDWLTDSR
jgi:predicted DNA-binding protein YlxM (UPF0122 family)